MKNIPLANILQLSVQERIQLIQEIWDSIIVVPEAIPLTEAQRKLLDERLEDLAKNPDAGSPWPEVKARILSAS